MDGVDAVVAVPANPASYHDERSTSDTTWGKEMGLLAELLIAATSSKGGRTISDAAPKHDSKEIVGISIRDDERGSPESSQLLQHLMHQKQHHNNEVGSREGSGRRDSRVAAVSGAQASQEGGSSSRPAFPGEKSNPRTRKPVAASSSNPCLQPQEHDEPLHQPNRKDQSSKTLPLPKLLDLDGPLVRHASSGMESAGRRTPTPTSALTPIDAEVAAGQLVYLCQLLEAASNNPGPTSGAEFK